MKVTKTILISLLASLVIIVSVAVGLPREQAAAVGGPDLVTAGGAGIFPAGASFAGVQLAGGTFGIGVQTDGAGTAKGDLEAQLNGNSLIGLSQWVTITGWITSGTLNPDGSMTFNGTCTLDMGDGTPPTGGVALVANLSGTGLTLTVGSTVLPTLPKSDGWVAIE
jgi:hypothetical protein